MTITELAIEKGIEPEKAREFLREWLDMQPVVTRIVADSYDDYTNATITLIARPNMEDL